MNVELREVDRARFWHYGFDTDRPLPAPSGICGMNSSESNAHLDKGNSPKEAMRVADEIRRQIYKGYICTGDKFLPEKDLAQVFHVSRPTLREAFRILEAESLITIMRGRGGVRVRPPSTEALARQVGGYLQRQGANLEDILDARLMIEPIAAGLLAANADIDTIRSLEENVQECEKMSSCVETWERLIHEFPKILIEKCGNKTIGLIGRINQTIILSQYALIGARVIIRSLPDPTEEQGRFLQERRNLIAAVENRDSAKATEVWREHLRWSEQVLLSAYWSQMPIDVHPAALTEEGLSLSKLALSKKAG